MRTKLEGYVTRRELVKIIEMSDGTEFVFIFQTGTDF